MDIKVIGKRVLVKIVESEEQKTESGLVIAGKPPAKLIVIGVGTKVESDIKIGDQITWQKGARMERVKLDNQDVCFFDEKDIASITRGEE